VADQSPQHRLLGLDLDELLILIESLEEPAYRASSFFSPFTAIGSSPLSRFRPYRPACVRIFKARGISIGLPSIDSKFKSTDGTVRYLLCLPRRQTVEAVWMPEGDGGEAGDGSAAGDEAGPQTRTWDRSTICVSSQVGCAWIASFASRSFGREAQPDRRRDRRPGLFHPARPAASPPQDRVNLVFMGMGEPFLNYDNFMKAVRLLVEGRWNS